jgi:hypothetical protein
MKCQGNKYFATRSPRSVLRDARFWLKHERSFIGFLVLFHLVFVALIAVDVIPLSGLARIRTLEVTQPDALAIVIQAAIYILGLAAFARAARAIARARVETDCARHVAESCEREIRDIRERIREPIDILDVPALWPKNPAKDLATLRLCKAVHVDGLDRQFGAKDSLLTHYADEHMSSIAILQNRQRAALHLGILGTFLGFVFAMPSLVSVTAGAFDVKAFGPLFDALKVCFTTSVVGLVVSLTIGGVHSYVMRRHTMFFQCLEDAANGLMVVVRNARNTRNTAQSFEQVNNSLDQIVDRMASQNDRMQLQTDAFVDGMAKLKTTKYAMDEFIDGISQVNAHVIAAVESITERMSPERFFQQIDEEMQNAIETLGSEIQSSVSSGVDALQASAAALATCSVAVRQDVAEHRDAIATLHEESSRASARMYATLSRGLQEILDQVKEEANQARTEATKLSSMQASLIHNQAVAVRTLAADGHRRSILSMFTRRKARSDSEHREESNNLVLYEPAEAMNWQEECGTKRGNGTNGN